MFHEQSPEDRALIRKPSHVKRYLAFAPRIPVLTATVIGIPSVDSDTGGVYSFHIADPVYEDPTFVQPGYTVDIGSAPGLHDIGQYRLRGLPDLDLNILNVNETAQGSVPIEAGQYVTVIAEYKIWQRRMRRVITSEDPPAYTEFIDYNYPCSQFNSTYYPPVANITRDHFFRPVKRAGFVDAGHSYRTLTLSSFHSFAPLHEIDHVLWTLRHTSGDGDISTSYIVGGTATSTDITIRAPIGILDVELHVVSTGGGGQLRYMRLWTFEDEDDPLLITKFSVDNDTRGEGRDMSFTINDEKAANIGKGVEIIYFEEATFDGDPAPEDYINQFCGWTIKGATLLRLYRSTYKMDVGGPKTILDLKGGYPQTVYDQRTPTDADKPDTKCNEMPQNTTDQMVHYLLRVYSTAIELMNLYFSSYNVPIEGYTSDSSSIWGQVTAVTERWFGNAACDSSGALWLVQNLQYLDDGPRFIQPPIIDVDSQDWLDSSPPEILVEESDKVAQVDMYGSNYDIVIDGDTFTEFSHIWRVQAPGIVQGDAKGIEQTPSIFLEASKFALDQLKKLAGHHFARLNNKVPDITIAIRNNQDIIEPAWGEHIRFTYTEDNVRGIVLDGVRLLIKSVTVTHSILDGKPPKTISLSCELETYGYPGLEVEVLQREYVEPYPDGPTDSYTFLAAGTQTIAVFHIDGYISITHDFTSMNPTWVNTDLSSSLPAGYSVMFFIVDAFSPLYLGTGSAVNGWLFCNPPEPPPSPVLGDLKAAKVYRIENIFGSPVITLQYTTANVGTNFLGAQFERGVQGWGIATLQERISPAYTKKRGKVIYSTDGATWNEVLLATPIGAQNEAGSGDVHVSPHIPGHGYTCVGGNGFANGLFETNNYGATWALIDTGVFPNTALYGLHVPYQSLDDSILYYTRPSGPVGPWRRATGADVDLTPSGLPNNINLDFSRFAIKTCDIDQTSMVFAVQGQGSYVSSNSGTTWTQVSTTEYRSCNIAGDNPWYSYWWGGSGKIGMRDTSGSVLSKIGSGGTQIHNGLAVNICGGPP